MEMIVGTKAIDAEILKIKKAGERLDTKIQVVGLSVLQHIDDHGDVTLADRLYKALPNGARRNALVQWMLAYGKVRVLQKADAADAEKIADGSVFGYAKDKTTDISGAESVWWHSFMPERAPSEVFDAQAAATRLLKAIQSAHKKEKMQIIPVNPETLRLLDEALKQDMEVTVE